MDLPFETTKVRYFFIPTKFFDKKSGLAKNRTWIKSLGNFYSIR